MLRPATLVIGLCALLVGCAAPSAGASSAPPSAGPETVGVPDAGASAAESAEATRGELPTPVPVRTPAPAPGTLALEALSCDGGVVLEWSPSADPAFHHYTGLRSPQADISPFYPPISPAVDWGGAYATDRFVTSGVDASLDTSDDEWHYRVMSYDAEGRVLESSPVVTATIRPVADLGPLAVERVAGPRVRVEWTPYAGPGACFTEYRVVYGGADPPGTLLATVSARQAGSLETDVLRGAEGYVLRVDAVRATPLGSFVVGRSQVAAYEP